MPFKYFNTPPYYDDFDEAKNYVRILFRPGHAVQARELTQMQTAIQAQIARHGSHIFKEGSPVLGGNMTLDAKLDYVKIESSFVPASGGATLIADNYYEEFVGTTITGSTTGVSAKVIDVLPSDADGPITLYVKYNNSGDDNETKTFAFEEEISSDALIQRKGKVKPAIETPIGYGVRFNIDSGVFFVNGNFVYSESDSMILSRYTQDVSTRVVYLITENVVTISEDSTLGDNALGTSNEAAPGAHRYQILLQLATQPFSFEEIRDNNIIQLMLIQNGSVKERARTEYSELANTLAQRTYEESGNYAIKPFLLQLRELYNDGSNNGLYTIPQLRDRYNLINETDEQVISYGRQRLAAGLEKSIAYVNGYRIELEDIKYVDILKSRTTNFFNGASIVADLGNYILVNITQGLPDVDNLLPLNLLNSDSNAIGTARARSLDWVSSTTYKLYLFDIRMNTGSVFSEVASVQQTRGIQAQFIATTNGTLYETKNNSLVYKLPFNAVQTLVKDNQNDTAYIAKRMALNLNTVGEVTYTITGVLGETIQPYNPIDWIATNSSTGAAVSIVNVTLSTNDISETTSAQITFGAPGIYDIIYPVRKNTTRRTKTLQTNAEVTIENPQQTPGAYELLGLPDVVRIHSITDEDITIDNEGNKLDITDRYELDNGQRDNYYALARIRLKFDALPPDSNHTIKVKFDYYVHGAGDYFSVDSYINTDYDEIPTFNSSKGVLQLRDCIDFRPVLNPNDTDEFLNKLDVPKAGSIINTDIVYYLHRRDKIFVDKYGNFDTIEGVPGLNPALPRDPQDSMILYELFIGAYTFTPQSVVPKMIDNRRYTMRDIGRLDRRIKNLEYYTTLSLLEKEAADYELPADHFKNGFLVDNFYGHNVGNPAHPDYSCSIDKSKGILRPQFYENEVRLKWNDISSTGLRKTGPLLTLDYNEVSYIEQPYSSYAEFVNPYNVFTWTGDLKLSPESDNWKDTETRPDVIVDQEGVYDSFKQLADATGVTGTVWNEWQVAWSGTVPGSESTTSSTWNDPSFNSFVSGMGRAVNTTSTTTGTIQTESIRSGVRTEVVPDTVTTELGDRVVEVNFIPFIRSRIVAFHGTRMKPNTKLYAFFDGKDVTNYATQTDEFYSFSDFTSANPEYTSSYTFNGETEWPSDIVVKTDLVTDASGEIHGFFIVPNNDSMRFRTGQRIFRLTDAPDNTTSKTTTSAEAIYEATGLLESKENVILSTRVPRIDRTSVSDSRTTFQPGSIVAQTTRRTGWYDPLAQTIMVDEPGGIFATSLDLYFADYDPDIPVTVHLVTTTVGIPSMNIIPFSKVTKTLTSANISDDASVATTFTFEAPVHLQQGIEYAIVIMSMSDKPKCYVSVMGEYDLTNPTYRISKQPYMGVFFKSQNASTWTPEQEKDLKFKLNRANFNTSGQVVFNNVDLQATKLGLDPLYTTNSSNVIRVYHKNHGLFVNSSTIISGVVGTSGTALNGIPLSEINKTHTVTGVQKDYYEITTTTSANATNSTGRVGGSSVYSLGNRLMDIMQFSVQELIIPDTNISWYAKTSSGRSTAGDESVYQLSTSFYPIVPNQNTYFTRPQCVPNTENVVTPGTIIRGDIVSNTSYLSPVIDLDRVSVFAICNMIDWPSSVNAANDSRNYVVNYVEETSPTGGSVQSKYITRVVSLEDSANQINVIIDINRPTGTDVELYYKVSPSADDSFDELPWVLQNPDVPVGYNDDRTSYSEVKYSIDDELNGLEFTSMAFKIVFKSINNSVVPSCKNFRAIAIYG